jgi:hypothetical protein
MRRRGGQRGLFWRVRREVGRGVLFGMVSGSWSRLVEGRFLRRLRGVLFQRGSRRGCRLFRLGMLLGLLQSWQSGRGVGMDKEVPE